MSRIASCLLLALGMLGLAGSTRAGTYHCAPTKINDAALMVEVECAEPSRFEGGYPRDGADAIHRFGVPKIDHTFGSQFLHVAQTALTAGIVMRIHYDDGDTNGGPWGCDASSCRRATSFGLMAPSASVRVPHAELPSGVTERIARGQWRYFGPFSIGRSGSKPKEIRAALSGGSGDPDLYIRKVDRPTLSSANVCASRSSTATESCTVKGDGTYYVGVYGYGPSNTFRLSVTIAPQP